MRSAHVLFLGALGFLVACQSKSLKPVESAPTKVTSADPGVISGQRQMTYVGPRSGEGYFSPDGRWMIFQSEREAGNPFYQIYLMDMRDGSTKRVSPGNGKTTCAWIHPSMNKVLFSSTHLDPDLAAKVKQELESRKNGVKAKYSWSYDENFDLFSTDMNGKNPVRLTKEKGYDAEASYSPDGQYIAFASNRQAYSQKLSPEDEKIFAQDPSYMMDIYLMKSDGSEVKQLTFEKGYDGGPFFSPDGKKITWRRFSPNGQSAEVYTMNLDGSAQKQITHLKSMSWAPFFHPSGDYVIFTTNVMGYGNFELYIVDAEGKHEPVRVSYLDGFDGLPVFLPDGRRLAWTHRNEKGDSQILIADWNDQLARTLLGLKPAPISPMTTEPPLSVSDAKAWVKYLSSDAMGGRASGSPQEKIYTAAIADVFKKMGLKPVVGKSFFQEFSFPSGVKMGPKNQLVTKLDGAATTLKVAEKWVPLSLSKSGEFPAAPVAFVGYGIVAPATDKQSTYDSYSGLDVKGKWVIAFRDIPENVPNELRFHLNLYSRPHHKALVARNHGAVGLILINGPNSSYKQPLQLRFEGSVAEAGLPVLSMTDSEAARLFKRSKNTLKGWQDLLDKGEMGSDDLFGAEIQAQVDLEIEKSTGINVLARLEVPGATRSVVIGAHGDHLGRGEMGNSLARNDERGQIHYGADDNASGVAGVMGLAHYFADAQTTGRAGLKQNLIFAVWSAEELGVLGSSHFANQYKGQPLTAYLNMDMIGRLKDQLLVQGMGSAKEWEGLVERLAVQTSLSLSAQSDPYLPTDAMTFYMKGVPSISFFTGSHAEYHSPRDRAELLNYEGLVKTLYVVKDLTQLVAGTAHSGLTYQKVEGSRKLEGRSFRLYLGTIPDYTQEGIKGVRISGTTKESPAEKAGLQGGDVIVELGNTKIENLYDYVYCLQSMKGNQQTGIKVLRSGRVVELQITPALKDM